MSRLRVALVHPTYWPEVRRGSERVVHDLAAYLRGRGLEASVLTGHRGVPSSSSEDGVRVLRTWRPPERLRPRGFEPYAGHAPLALVSLLRHRFDIVHAFHVPDAAAASLWARITRRPLVVSMMGFPDRISIDAVASRRRMLRFAARRADRLHLLSDAAARALREATGLEADPIPPGTWVGAFRHDGRRSDLPTIFCAASAADPRKGVAELIDAFGLLRRERPDARLVLSGPLPERLAPRLSEPGVESVDLGSDQAALVRAYGSAWATVLPSVREAFGQVLVESLAAGTPVVAIRSGAAPEIVEDGEVGVLADSREPSPLAAALAAGLELSRRPRVEEACRTHAARWDWSVVGPRFEALYEEAIGARGPAR